MSLSNATLLSGATVSVSGGTAITFGQDDLDVVGGIHVSDVAAVDFRTRKAITIKARAPKLVNGVFSKGKRSATLTIPRINTAGAVEYPLARIELEFSAENSLAEIDELMKLAAQCAVDLDFANFWRTGSRV